MNSQHAPSIDEPGGSSAFPCRATLARLGQACGILIVLPLAACATYGERTSRAFADFERGRFRAAEEDYADESRTDSEFLSGAEAGTAALVAGWWEKALDHFERAQSEVSELEERALVSPLEWGETLISFAINDTFQAYPGEGYERVMLHASMALCYVGLGRLEDVYVEARRANRLLESEEKLYEKGYRAGGLGHFVSALAYELLDEPGEAFIDYQRMVEKDVGTELAGRALVRLSKELGYESEHARWAERFGEAAEVPEGAASIVVIAGVGTGPYKGEHGLSVPLEHGIAQWVVPQFHSRPQPISALVLHVSGSTSSVRTSVIEDVSRVAAENLEDRIGWLAAKSAVRAALKYELQRRMEKEHGGLGLIAGALFTIATERADLRSWTTLPNTWQAARAFIAPGRHEVVLAAEGGERRVVGEFELESGETLFILARTLGTELYTHPIGGLRVDSSPAQP